MSSGTASPGAHRRGVTGARPGGAPASHSAAQAWLARTAFAALALAALALVGFALVDALWLLVTAAVGVMLVAASAWWFLTRRGWQRWVALGLVVAVPVVLAVLFVREHLLWVAALALGLLLVAAAAGREALARDHVAQPMPEHVVPPPKRPFIVMNPRSGGGKVGRFGLKEKAQELGAEVALLEGPGTVDVAELAREAVAAGADLLGVAGGDGTQALVAGVAAEHGLPFLVISAGTRNHFALDLGLDREDPSTCLAGLTDDAVELHVDLGEIAGRTFVNNASFGAYAEVVQSPAYRDDKRGTTLEMLPDLLTGRGGAHLSAQADGVTVDGPQAVLVSVNPYETGDLAGMGRRARLDTGRLGVVSVSVDNARQAVGLLRLTHEHGVTRLEAPAVVVTADRPEVPVGIDGEAVILPTPVTCTIRPQALRVRVPRSRPGVPPPTPVLNWVRLRHLAFGGG